MAVNLDKLDPLRYAYERANKYYNMPEYDKFLQSLETDSGRVKLHGKLSKYYNVPDFETFDSTIASQLKPTVVQQEPVKKEQTKRTKWPAVLHGFMDVSHYAGKTEAMAFNVLGLWSNWIVDKTGMPEKYKNGIFMDLKNLFNKAADEAAKRGTDPTAGGLSKVALKINEIIGGLAVDLPLVYQLGLPAFGAVYGGAGEIAKGEKGNVLTGVTLGAAEGIALHYGLKAANVLPLVERLMASGAVFSVKPLAEELQKPEDQRDYGRVVENAAIGAVLSALGKGGVPRKELYEPVTKWLYNKLGTAVTKKINKDIKKLGSLGRVFEKYNDLSRPTHQYARWKAMEVYKVKGEQEIPKLLPKPKPEPTETAIHPEQTPATKKYVAKKEMPEVEKEIDRLTAKGNLTEAEQKTLADLVMKKSGLESVLSDTDENLLMSSLKELTQLQRGGKIVKPTTEYIEGVGEVKVGEEEVTTEPTGEEGVIPEGEVIPEEPVVPEEPVIPEEKVPVKGEPTEEEVVGIKQPVAGKETKVKKEPVKYTGLQETAKTGEAMAMVNTKEGSTIVYRENVHKLSAKDQEQLAKDLKERNVKLAEVKEEPKGEAEYLKSLKPYVSEATYGLPKVSRANKIYHGTQEKNIKIDQNGNLILNPSDNFSGKQVGVSFTRFRDTAKFYGEHRGGKKRGVVPGTAIIEIDKSALPNLRQESMEELFAETKENIVVPKGKFKIHTERAGSDVEAGLKEFENKIRNKLKKLGPLELGEKIFESAGEGELAEHYGENEAPFAHVESGSISEAIVQKYGARPQAVVEGKFAGELFDEWIEKNGIDALIKLAKKKDLEFNKNFPEKNKLSIHTPYGAMSYEDMVRRLTEKVSQIDLQKVSKIPSEKVKGKAQVEEKAQVKPLESKFKVTDEQSKQIEREIEDSVLGIENNVESNIAGDIVDIGSNIESDVPIETGIGESIESLQESNTTDTQTPATFQQTIDRNTRVETVSSFVNWMKNSYPSTTVSEQELSTFAKQNKFGQFVKKIKAKYPIPSSVNLKRIYEMSKNLVNRNANGERVGFAFSFGKKDMFLLPSDRLKVNDWEQRAPIDDVADKLGIELMWSAGEYSYGRRKNKAGTWYSFLRKSSIYTNQEAARNPKLEDKTFNYLARRRRKMFERGYVFVIKSASGKSEVWAKIPQDIRNKYENKTITKKDVTDVENEIRRKILEEGGLKLESGEALKRAQGLLSTGWISPVSEILGRKTRVMVKPETSWGYYDGTEVHYVNSPENIPKSADGSPAYEAKPVHDGPIYVTPNWADAYSKAGGLEKDTKVFKSFIWYKSGNKTLYGKGLFTVAQGDVLTEMKKNKVDMVIWDDSSKLDSYTGEIDDSAIRGKFTEHKPVGYTVFTRSILTQLPQRVQNEYTDMFSKAVGLISGEYDKFVYSKGYAPRKLLDLIGNAVDMQDNSFYRLLKFNPYLHPLLFGQTGIDNPLKQIFKNEVIINNGIKLPREGSNSFVKPDDTLKLKWDEIVVDKNVLDAINKSLRKQLKKELRIGDIVLIPRDPTVRSDSVMPLKIVGTHTNGNYVSMNNARYQVFTTGDYDGDEVHVLVPEQFEIDYFGSDEISHLNGDVSDPLNVLPKEQREQVRERLEKKKESESIYNPSDLYGMLYRNSRGKDLIGQIQNLSTMYYILHNNNVGIIDRKGAPIFFTIGEPLDLQDGDIIWKPKEDAKSKQWITSHFHLSATDQAKLDVLSEVYKHPMDMLEKLFDIHYTTKTVKREDAYDSFRKAISPLFEVMQIFTTDRESSSSWTLDAMNKRLGKFAQFVKSNNGKVGNTAFEKFLLDIDRRGFDYFSDDFRKDVFWESHKQAVQDLKKSINKHDVSKVNRAFKMSLSHFNIVSDPSTKNFIGYKEAENQMNAMIEQENLTPDQRYALDVKFLDVDNKDLIYAIKHFAVTDKTLKKYFELYGNYAKANLVKFHSSGKEVAEPKVYSSIFPLFPMLYESVPKTVGSWNRKVGSPRKNKSPYKTPELQYANDKQIWKINDLFSRVLDTPFFTEESATEFVRKVLHDAGRDNFDFEKNPISDREAREIRRELQQIADMLKNKTAVKRGLKNLFLTPEKVLSQHPITKNMHNVYEQEYKRKVSATTNIWLGDIRSKRPTGYIDKIADALGFVGKTRKLLRKHSKLLILGKLDKAKAIRDNNETLFYTVDYFKSRIENPDAPLKAGVRENLAVSVEDFQKALDKYRTLMEDVYDYAVETYDKWIKPYQYLFDKYIIQQLVGKGWTVEKAKKAAIALRVKPPRKLENYFPKIVLDHERSYVVGDIDNILSDLFNEDLTPEDLLAMEKGVGFWKGRKKTGERVVIEDPITIAEARSLAEIQARKTNMLRALTLDTIEKLRKEHDSIFLEKNSPTFDEKAALKYIDLLDALEKYVYSLASVSQGVPKGGKMVDKFAEIASYTGINLNVNKMNENIRSLSRTYRALKMSAYLGLNMRANVRNAQQGIAPVMAELGRKWAINANKEVGRGRSAIERTYTVINKAGKHEEVPVDIIEAVGVNYDDIVSLMERGMPSLPGLDEFSGRKEIKTFLDKIEKHAQSLAQYTLEHTLIGPVPVKFLSFIEMEYRNRSVTAVAAYDYKMAQFKSEINAGLLTEYRAHNIAIQFARKMVDKLQYEYSMFNRPEWLRGPIGSSVFLFKSYTVNTMQLHYDWYYDAKNAVYKTPYGMQIEWDELWKPIRAALIRTLFMLSKIFFKAIKAGIVVLPLSLFYLDMPELDFVEDLYSLLTGKKKDVDKTFYGYGPYGALTTIFGGPLSDLAMATYIANESDKQKREKAWWNIIYGDMPFGGSSIQYQFGPLINRPLKDVALKGPSYVYRYRKRYATPVGGWQWFLWRYVMGYMGAGQNVGFDSKDPFGIDGLDNLDSNLKLK